MSRKIEDYVPRRASVSLYVRLKVNSKMAFVALHAYKVIIDRSELSLSVRLEPEPQENPMHRHWN